MMGERRDGPGGGVREGLKGAKRKKVKTNIILIRINKIKYYPEFERGFKKCKEKKVKSNIILIKIKILSLNYQCWENGSQTFLEGAGRKAGKKNYKEPVTCR